MDNLVQMTSPDLTTLSTDDITDRVRRQTIGWVQVMQSEYGQSMGLKCFDVIRQTFGEDLCGAVLFGILSGHSYGDKLTITTAINQPVTRKIEAIKTVRHITGMGLKEAKDAVEASEFSNVDILLSWEYRKPEHAGELERHVKDLERCGLTVR